jgi:hypothetical protein
MRPQVFHPARRKPGIAVLQTNKNKNGDAEHGSILLALARADR